uniref:Uncharacterized protein n=2 Tax=Anguilla anguilla TaxID=7936 RepID=A0A0E9THW3_ANGAN
MRILWSTVSKAALRSRRTRTESFRVTSHSEVGDSKASLLS